MQSNVLNTNNIIHKLIKEQMYVSKAKLYEREKWRFQIEMSLRPGLLWVALNLVLIIQLYRDISYN
jgi:hypothetical protein